MPRRDLVHEDGVFHFDRLSHMALVSQRRISAEVAVRSDLAVFPDDRNPFDIDPGQNDGSFAEDQGSVNEDSFPNRSFDLAFLDFCEQFFMNFQQMPGIEDREAVFIDRNFRCSVRNGLIVVQPCQRFSLRIDENVVFPDSGEFCKQLF